MTTEFTTHGFTIDLDVVYHAMWAHSEIEGDERVFNGGKKGVPAMKRLIADCSMSRWGQDAPGEPCRAVAGAAPAA